MEYRLAKSADDEYIYQGGYFLNLGLQYDVTDTVMVRLDGYNLLGFCDKDLNAVKSVSEDWLPEEYNIMASVIGVSAVFKLR